MSKGDKLRTNVDVLTRQIDYCIQSADLLFDALDNIDKMAIELLKLREEFEQELSEMEEKLNE